MLLLGVWNRGNRVVVCLAGESELAVSGLVAGGVLNLDKVLVVRQGGVLGQLKQANESLQVQGTSFVWRTPYEVIEADL